MKMKVYLITEETEDFAVTKKPCDYCHYYKQDVFYYSNCYVQFFFRTAKEQLSRDVVNTYYGIRIISKYFDEQEFSINQIKKLIIDGEIIIENGKVFNDDIDKIIDKM